VPAKSRRLNTSIGRSKQDKKEAERQTQKDKRNTDGSNKKRDKRERAATSWRRCWHAKAAQMLCSKSISHQVVMQVMRDRLAYNACLTESLSLLFTIHV
jgi:hypothetical protein